MLFFGGKVGDDGEKRSGERYEKSRPTLEAGRLLMESRLIVT